MTGSPITNHEPAIAAAQQTAPRNDSKIRQSPATSHVPRTTFLFNRRDSVLDRELDQTSDVANMQLLHQAAAVGVDALR